MPALCPTGQLLLTECYLYSKVLVHPKKCFLSLMHPLMISKKAHYKII